MKNVKNKKVTIVGAKRSGLALAKLVIRLGGIPRVTDQDVLETWPEEFRHQKLSVPVELEAGAHTPEFVQKCDILVLSPGVSLNSPVVKWADQKGIPVFGEIEFAAQFCDKPIIGITGSNGKTTVSTLVHEVLTAGGLRSCLCGNVGYPFSNYVLDLQDKDFVVVELSSFQLESVHAGGFKPHIGILLNFSQNHLDRHKDLDEYFNAKKRLFLNQDRKDYAVLNYRNERIRALANEVTSQVRFFDDPAHPSAESQNPNHLAVEQVARILKIDPKIYWSVLKNFKGVEHRMEFVRTLRGVDYVNDSKATTAEAASWALRQIQRPIVMICGGRDKNIDFSVLNDLIKTKVKKMIVIGEARDKIKRTFNGLVPIEEGLVFDEAIQKAQNNAHAGDCVLLSPMCASFDMFKDYEHRGRAFKEIVQKLS